ncbi:hypothetical protein CQA62_04595 [Helicobacter cholecystus]|uniref:Uncharacterized protein n=1 Tax=Helicobacter cholecystus TaxID=45498 RepID=A0A3D8IV58_9HELI|nr:autotransporter outer membrane beta-barrel domain-containing protein [Helicobacter cholecystus]RDU68890.1 hypothetical protein CQA62_04595 [Helicobacter cholecystus]VEJ25831.1 outer membrane protein [Helicobacter cholecystus]
MKQKIIALLLACNCVFAFDLGLFTLDTEIGGNANYTSLKTNIQDKKYKNTKHLNYGAYGRIWLGVAGLMIAPQVKWNYLSTNINTDPETKIKFHNMQYGAVLGYKIPFINITPYAGVSYSDFISQDLFNQKLKSTYAINFGINWKIPFLPLAIGFDGSYQKPKFQDNNQGAKKIEILTLGGTLSLIF